MANTGSPSDASDPVRHRAFAGGGSSGLFRECPLKLNQASIAILDRWTHGKIKKGGLRTFGSGIKEKSSPGANGSQAVLGGNHDCPVQLRVAVIGKSQKITKSSFFSGKILDGFSQ